MKQSGQRETVEVLVDFKLFAGEGGTTLYSVKQGKVENIGEGLCPEVGL